MVGWRTAWTWGLVAALGCAETGGAPPEPMPLASSYLLTIDSTETVDPESRGDASWLVGHRMRLDFDADGRRARVTPEFHAPIDLDIAQLAGPVRLDRPIPAEDQEFVLFGSSWWREWVAFDLRQVVLPGSIMAGSHRLRGSATLSFDCDERVQLDTGSYFQAVATAVLTPDDRTPEVRVDDDHPYGVVLPWEPIGLRLSEPVDGMPTSTETDRGRAELVAENDTTFALHPAEGWWRGGVVSLELPALVDAVGNERGGGTVATERVVVDGEPITEPTSFEGIGAEDPRHFVWGQEVESTPEGLALATWQHQGRAGVFLRFEGSPSAVEIDVRVQEPRRALTAADPRASVVAGIAATGSAPASRPVSVPDGESTIVLPFDGDGGAVWIEADLYAPHPSFPGAVDVVVRAVRPVP